MPRRMTDRIIERKEQIYNLLKEKGEMSTSEIVRETGLTHSQTFYVLRLLMKEGRVKEIKRGKVAYWVAE
ncbi:MAG: DNA-binding protein [Thermoprotei archaeon]|nr:MAG: DNA-binding protein [Thermoprotei archaeon]RLF20775.1 MAG: DNA-binding protein [Thermoprotei archaeon]